jgi:hypothetical protein
MNLYSLPFNLAGYPAIFSIWYPAGYPASQFWYPAEDIKKAELSGLPDIRCIP